MIGLERRLLTDKQSLVPMLQSCSGKTTPAATVGDTELYIDDADVTVLQTWEASAVQPTASLTASKSNLF